MAQTLYVDGRNGNDSASGTTWAAALKTLGAAETAVTTGSTVYCTGVFYETLTLVTTKSVTFEAVGFAILDGRNALTVGVSNTATNGTYASNVLKGFRIRNYTTSGIACGGNPGTDLVQLTLQDCVIENCQTGVNYPNVPAGSGRWFVQLTRVVVRDCTTGVSVAAAVSSAGVKCTSCTFTDCTYAHYMGTAVVNQTFNNCIFSHNTYHHYISAGCTIYAPTNYNLIDFSSGKCYWRTGDSTSLTAWKASSGVDSNSIDDDPEYLDRAKKMHYLKKTSPAVIGGVILGAYNTLLAEGASTNYNTTVWDNPITLTNCEKDGTGNYVIASGASEGVVEWEFDFGVPRAVKRINLNHAYSGAGAGVGSGVSGILDYDETDTLPETWTYRIDTSANGTDWDGYQEVDLYDDLALTGVRKLRVEVTMRTDA